MKKKVSNFCSFVKKRKKKNLISRTLAYFSVDSGMKLLSLCFSFLLAKNYITFTTNILSIRSSSLISALTDFQVWEVFYCLLQFQETICMVKKAYTSRAKAYINHYSFLSFTFTHNPTPKCVTFLFYYKILFNRYYI